MQNRIARILLIIFFIALLATPIIIKRLNARSEASKSSTNASTALARYGFRFEESSKAAGINFTHEVPTFDAKLNHIMTQVAVVGAAVSVVDFDRDGWSDFYVTNSGEGSKNALYRNQGNGMFRDVASDVGLADLNSRELGVSMGAVWGDYDNEIGRASCRERV